MITLDDIKTKIGLAPRPAKVYFALLKMGSGFASAIAAEAGVKRSTTYQILESLHQKGLVLKYIKGKKMFYAPAGPQAVLDFLDDQQEKIKQKKQAFQAILPEMRAFYEQGEKKPKLLFFDKKQEVEALILEVLRQKGENNVLGFISLDLWQANLTENFFKKYADEIKKQRTRLELINYDDDADVQQKTDLWLARYFSDLENLRPVVKILASKTDLTNLIFITASRAYLIDINPPEFMGTVIINPDLTRSLRVIFENLWRKI